MQTFLSFIRFCICATIYAECHWTGKERNGNGFNIKNREHEWNEIKMLASASGNWCEVRQDMI